LRLDVVSRVAASESTAECDANNALAPAWKNDRARPDRASARPKKRLWLWVPAFAGTTSNIASAHSNFNQQRPS
jgi:hypothetical protein